MTPQATAADSDLMQRAARLLAMFVGAAGALMIVLSLLRWTWGGPGGSVLAMRLAFGVVLLAGAGIALLQLRRGRARRASFAALLGATVAAIGVSAGVGTGLQGVGVAGIGMLIVLAGALASGTAATALTLLMFAGIGLLAGAELAGWLEPAAAVRGLGPIDRAWSLVVLGGLAWLAAQLARQVVGASLAQARTESDRLAALVRIGSDWAFELDRSGRLTWLAPSFEARTGRTVAEFLRLGEPGGPEVVPDAEFEALRPALAARRPFRDTLTTYRCADGTLLCVSSSGEPVHDADGHFTGWRGVSRNVTAEVLARRVQQREQALLDRLVRLSPDAITVVNVQTGAVLLANPSFLALAGRSEAEVIGRTAVDLGLWDDWSPAFRLRDALAAAPTLHDLRLPGRGRDGRLLDLQVAAAAFEWDGQPVAVIIGRDISPVERARRETEAILDNAAVGIAFVRDRQFERVNPQFERLFGRPAGSLAGQPTSVMFPDDDAYDAFAARADATHAAGRIVDIERVVPRPDGIQVTVRLRAQALDPQRLREGGTIWIVEDIGERRRAEQELAAAKQQAEAASRAKSSFLATMSHEIRTPLNGVLGLARLLQDPALDAGRRHDYLSHLVTAAEGLAGIVSDVLDLSKIEAGELQIEQIVFDLREVVTGTFHTFAPLGRERGLRMACRVGADVPAQVRGDPVRVRQILANYLSNALKFTATGGIEVEVEGGGGDRLRLSVQDTGPGVAPGLQERLFRPFAQADSSTTRRFGGTGLGLSICRDLAERMGGSVGVKSRPGEGSRFWAELPLPAAEPTPPPGPPAQPGRPPLHGLRVLVAEDNLVNMLIIGTQLRRLGAEVLEAEDGEAAVVLAQREHAGLHAVLMDLHMPVVDGLEAARRLRADPRTASLPVLALSAAVLEHDREQARAAGMRDFVAKPVEEADLVRALGPLLARAATR